MWALTPLLSLTLCSNFVLAAPRVWLEYSDEPEALMASNDSGAELRGCRVQWELRYDTGRHYTEVALADLPANGQVKVHDCHDWWNERWGKAMDVLLTLIGPDGSVLAKQDYRGVFKLVARRGLLTKGWSATASRGERTAAAFDGDLATRWDTGGKQEVGDWYMLDMGKPERLAGLIIDTRRSANDYPEGLVIDVSEDGDSWTRVANLGDTKPVNKRGKITLSFDPVTARYICLTLTRPHGDHWFWSIHELSVLPPQAGN